MPDFDVLVIGGGLAGLRAAIAARAAKASVALVSKVHPLRTNSAVNAGGLNAAMGTDDSVTEFAQDILTVGENLSDPQIVNIFAAEARDEVIWLDRMGVPFNRDAGGKLAHRRFGANRRNRSCYVDDRTGHTVLQVVYEQFQRERMPAFVDHFVTSLTIDGSGSPGVTAINLRTGALELFTARAIVLATGGFTRLYLPSTASIGTTGDGQNLAYLAGARLMDMEMIQFHPTVFPGGPGLLITDAVLGDGAQIVNQNGDGLVEQKSEAREKLSRSLYQALQNGSGSAFLDLRVLGKDKLASAFPQTCELVEAVARIDPSKQPVPIYPAAHRSIGGIETDATGRTSINGLFAAGECACNGLNGAGRLAGNTLTEALVFGKKTGEAAATFARSEQKKNAPAARLSDEERRLTSLVDSAAPSAPADSPLKLYGELAKLMNDNVGLARDAASLQSALGRVHELKDRYSHIRLRNSSRIYNSELTSYLELGSLLNIAELVATAAAARAESRGAHFRSDFPQRNDSQWNRHTIVSQVDGKPYVGNKSVNGG
ncbi:MAG TPA: FAD-dependent oxidoreductase [Candidatus Binataceae bacterium]|nr:FAD-dependent oxidoreductase [Candidatus Binataceae bacterium]